MSEVALICLRELNQKETDEIIFKLHKYKVIHLIGSIHNKVFMQSFKNVVVYPCYVKADRLIIGNTAVKPLPLRKMLTKMMLQCDSLVFVPDKYLNKAISMPGVWLLLDRVHDEGKVVDIYVSGKRVSDCYKGNVKYFFNGV